MKLPVPVNGSRMCTSLSEREVLNSPCSDVFDAGDHEVHQRLRGVDDAVGVGHLDAEALEKTLVYGVEEPLLFR